MNREQARELLIRFADGEASLEESLEALSRVETQELGFAKLDLHRRLRRGVPEVVFGEGKSQQQLASIVTRMIDTGSAVLVTRLSEEAGRELWRHHPGGAYDEISRTFLHHAGGMRPTADELDTGLLIVSAGTSDMRVAEEAAVTAESLGMRAERLYDVGVAGLGRLLEQQETLRQAAVIIVVAGMEGALPSVVAGLVAAPVVGVPTSVGYGAALGGMTSLFGMLTSCSGGLTVVNVDNGFGAACAARLMLSVRDRHLAEEDAPHTRTGRDALK